MGVFHGLLPVTDTNFLHGILSFIGDEHVQILPSLSYVPINNPITFFCVNQSHVA